MTPSALARAPRSKRAKWKIFRIAPSASSLVRFGAVAGRELHHAQPVAVRIEPHGLGVDRDRAAAVMREVRQIAAVQADGHDGSGEMLMTTPMNWRHRKRHTSVCSLLSGRDHG